MVTGYWSLPMLPTRKHERNRYQCRSRNAISIFRNVFVHELTMLMLLYRVRASLSSAPKFRWSVTAQRIRVHITSGAEITSFSNCDQLG
jgi:hypothetical protein